MSSRRSPLGALLQGAYLHSAWPCTPPPATLLALLCVALGSPMLACSSVGDTGEIASSSSASLSGADDTTGSLSSDSNPSGQGESTGGAQGGTDDDPGGIDTGSDSGGESTGAAPELPAPEPVPEDILETAKSDGEGCDLVNPISVTLRTVDASATVSPTQARDAALSDWVSLTGIRIRPWEFFNYYAFSYAPAEYGALSITPQLIVAPGTAEDKSNSPEFILQIGVTTHALPAEQRPPVRLTLALDNSNSMSGKAQDMLRATGKAIAANLRQGDVLSIVTWNAKNPTILELHDISGPSDPVVLDKLDQLQLGGSAELYSGLVTAYKLADAGFDPQAWNRVILVSDGGATANETDLAIIADHAEKPGIYLAGVGVGDAGIYRSDMMDAAAHAGRGPSLFVGNEAEADKRFGAQFVRTLGAAVRDVQIRIDLPGGFEVLRDPEQDSLTNPDISAGGVRLGPNNSLVLHRRLRSCDPLAGKDGKLLVHVGYTDESTGEPESVKSIVPLAELLAEPPASQASLFKGIALQSYAEALERWQARPPDLASILNEAATRLKAALELLPNDPELAEMATVIEILSTD